MPSPPHDLDRPALIAALRARIARLERGGRGQAEERAAAVPLCPPMDAALPWGGLARAGLHEVLSADPGAAAGFCALVLARASRAGFGGADGGDGGGGGPVLWIAPEPDAWPPGMARFGLSPADLVLVQAPRPADGLWAMEEALRCPAVAAALLVAREEPDLTAARRLQLAAEAGGALGLLLRPDSGGDEAAGPTAALTRWRVAALPSVGGGGAHDLGDPRWALELLRCRGGRPGAWRAVWRAAAEALVPDEGAGAGEEEGDITAATGLQRGGRRMAAR